MRRKENEITDPAAVEDVLRRAKFLRLALADGIQPYIVTVCFGFEPGRVYFHSATAGRKLDVIRANPRVAFTADVGTELVIGPKGCASTVKYQSVVGFGKASIVDDPDEKLRGLDLIMSQYAAEGAQPGGYAPQALERTLVVRIDVETLTGKQSGQD